MVSIAFAMKFSMTIFLLGLHLGLALLFVLSLTARSGGNVEAIALGIEAVQLILIPIRLYFYLRYRKSPSRLQHERLFFVCLWVISLASAIWVSIHSPKLLDDFAGLSYPEPAAIAAITLTWLAWTLTVHLIWITVQEHNDAQDDDEPVPWPAYTKPLPPVNRPKRISAKIVAVAHGSDPLLWDRKKNRHGQDYPPPKAPRPAMPTYDPRDRRQAPMPPQLPQVPRTTYNSWYNAEAM
ncbi:uncharacterized protein TRAVEDRAFT_45833 [Trametes versicolor FP-101664 SS1]|uniref:uncharacterized protein n=1 Tax=Trametes versicolor (strain FP-101664) TaxID=717944 RepID=UPI00046247D1|nr:uncharacterized protein TRAVEDRAFT_45833 [Trametes versicolor FP-101664 SS1]EIW60585.1 hypothetical protein TRAVEDRAFT_45833 [Trametes versicolor FP-101664 SS1]